MPGHSTELAVLRLVYHVIAQMDIYNVPINIVIDLSKAFDTIGSLSPIIEAKILWYYWLLI